MTLKILAGTEGALLTRGGHLPKPYTTTRDVVFGHEQFLFKPCGTYEEGSMAAELAKQGLCGMIDANDDPRQPKHILIVRWEDVVSS